MPNRQGSWCAHRRFALGLAGPRRGIPWLAARRGAQRNCRPEAVLVLGWAAGGRLVGRRRRLAAALARRLAGVAPASGPPGGLCCSPGRSVLADNGCLPLPFTTECAHGRGRRSAVHAIVRRRAWAAGTGLSHSVRHILLSWLPQRQTRTRLNLVVLVARGCADHVILSVVMKGPNDPRRSRRVAAGARLPADRLAGP
jgi:hypothetical protein